MTSMEGTAQISNVLRQVLLLVAALALLAWSLRRASGKLAAKAAFGPLLFLVTRRWVIVGWVVGASACFAWLMPMALAHGHGAPADYLTMAGVSLLSGGGFGFIAVGIPFLVLRAASAAPQVALEPGEEVLYRCAGNHYLAGESRAGRLLFTNRRVCFQPHRFNVQRAPWSVRLEQIQSMATEGTRFLVLTTSLTPAVNWLVVFHPKDLLGYLRALKERSESERPAESELALRAAGLRA